LIFGKTLIRYFARYSLFAIVLDLYRTKEIRDGMVL